MNPLFKLKRAYVYLQGWLGLKSSDVVLASYPKSGNTWVRFFFCNLIAVTEKGGATVDFKMLDTEMPEYGASNLLKSWPYQVLPRLVKTHLSYRTVFKKNKAILVIRDFRDVMVSYYKFKQKTSRETFTQSFSEFIRHPKFGLEACIQHYISWKDRAMVTITYEDIKKDDLTTFRNLLQAMKVDVKEEAIEEAVFKSKFDQVKKLEDAHGLSDPKKVLKEFKFTRDGSTGGWKNMFLEEDIKYYEALKSEYRIDIY